MAKYLDYTGLTAFKTKCDETYLKASDSIDTIIFKVDASLENADTKDGKFMLYWILKINNIMKYI